MAVSSGVLRRAEARLHVPMAFHDVLDFEPIGDIAKKDHVALVGKAADVRAQLATSAPHSRLERRQLMTLGSQFLDKGFGYGTLALASAI